MIFEIDMKEIRKMHDQYFVTKWPWCRLLNPKRLVYSALVALYKKQMALHVWYNNATTLP